MSIRMINEFGAVAGMRLAGETVFKEEEKPDQAPFC
jgi:hypothetical protein